MSRIGNKIIPIPAGVTVTVADGVVTVKGPKGTEAVNFVKDLISVDVNENKVHVTRANDEKHTKQLHGTTRALIHNAVVGVTEGFSKTLDIIGIGYRAEMKGDKVVLYIGHVEPTTVAPLPGVKIAVVEAKGKDVTSTVVVSGSNRFAVGQTAALIHDARRPEPYLGKGIRYRDEYILRKEGKRAGAKK